MQREAELLPVAYFHIVFTLPHELNQLVLESPKKVYNSLFDAGWNTIKTLAEDPRFLGAKAGMVAVLHTWGQKLWLHPHIHCIVPAGGITKAGNWKNARYKSKYLFPQKAMGKIYRAKFVAKLRKSGVSIPQHIAKAIFSKDWVVYAKRPFANPKTVVEYLGRYTHKIAISNHRLISINNEKVRFHYKDYRKGARKNIAELTAVEFLRRLCWHVLPKGFVRMRHYGFLASRNKAKELNIAKKQLGQPQWKKTKINPIVIGWKAIALQKLNIDSDKCPKCKNGILETIQIVAPERGPPVFKITPNLKFEKQ